MEKTIGPANFSEVVARTRKYEFEALAKLVMDIGVELRLLAALAEQSESDVVEVSKVKEIARRYEDRYLDVLRETIHKLNSVR